MLKFAAVLTAGLLASVSAFAADLPNGVASPGLLRGDSAYNWSGIYAGASAGRVSDKISSEAANAVFGQPKPTGFIGGVQVGFNKQAGALVVGVEGDFSLSNARGENRGAFPGKYGSATISGSGSLEGGMANLGTVRARLGYSMDNVLLYATGGYAFARQKLAFSGALTAPATAISSSNTMSGWVVGGGVEYAFARGVSLKAEYLYLEFAKSTFFGAKWAETTTKASTSVFRTGVNFRI